jgi:response regulator RpfG family c-di-GMP phosphodiesterase
VKLTNFKKKVSLILVDVQTDMDGYEFVEIIKSHPDTVFSHYFVTAISNEQKYLSKAYDLGAIDFYLNL